jgi:hypothetical protein
MEGAEKERRRKARESGGWWRLERKSDEFGETEQCSVESKSERQSKEGVRGGEGKTHA